MIYLVQIQTFSQIPNQSRTDLFCQCSQNNKKSIIRLRVRRRTDLFCHVPQNNTKSSSGTALKRKGKRPRVLGWPQVRCAEELLLVFEFRCETNLKCRCYQKEEAQGYKILRRGSSTLHESNPHECTDKYLYPLIPSLMCRFKGSGAYSLMSWEYRVILMGVTCWQSW
jgi:hypothetical protein